MSARPIISRRARRRHRHDAALRSPGSTLKPFIYALAFENGIAHPETLLDDRPSRYGIYAPENFDLTFQGQVSARKALQFSLNIPAVDAADRSGADALSRPPAQCRRALVLRGRAPGLAIGLGGLGIALTDLARLYAALRAGRSARPRRTSRYAAPNEANRASPSRSPGHVADILRGAPPPANAPAGKISFKTGTSYGYRDALAVGFDRAYTIAVWLGRADNGAVPGLVGRQVAAPILFDAFARAGAPTTNAASAECACRPQANCHRRCDRSQGRAQSRRQRRPAQLKIAYPPEGARVDLGLVGRRGMRWR